MFYIEDGKWKPMTKKIKYTRESVAYDTDDAPYLNNPKFRNVIVEPVVLTSDQLARLKRVETLNTSIKDIDEYVINGTINPENETLKKSVEDATLRDLIAKYVPVSELSETQQGTLNIMEVM